MRKSKMFKNDVLLKRMVILSVDTYEVYVENFQMYKLTV